MSEKGPFEQMQEFVAVVKERGAEMKAFEGLFEGISASLGDIVEMLEKNSQQVKAAPAAKADYSEMIAAIKTAIAGIKVPDVDVKVAGPQLSFETPATAPAQVVVEPAPWSSIVIQLGKPNFDGSRTATLKKVA